MAELSKKFELAEGVENLTITVNATGESGTETVTISDWPYETRNDSVILSLRGSSNVVEVEPPKKARAAAVRKAQELEVDIQEVEPSGSDDNVTVDDVEKHAEANAETS